jgi:hypothetical protein
MPMNPNSEKQHLLAVERIHKQDQTENLYTVEMVGFHKDGPVLWGAEVEPAKDIHTAAVLEGSGRNAAQDLGGVVHLRGDDQRHQRAGKPQDCRNDGSKRCRYKNCRYPCMLANCVLATAAMEAGGERIAGGYTQVGSEPESRRTFGTGTGN